MSKCRPKTGARVRVVLEGEVGLTDGAGFYLRAETASASSFAADGHVVSVEKLAPPLPTTPGSVIRYYGTPYARTTDGRWHSLRSGNLYFSNEFDDSDDIVVLFDAGKVES